jgi:hypothetical protein
MGGPADRGFFVEVGMISVGGVRWHPLVGRL